MKKIIIFFTMALLFSIGVNAQTLSTTTTQPSVGAIEIPINVASIPTVLSLTVYMEFDDAVLTYTGFTNSVPNTTVSIAPGTTNVLKVIVADFPNSTTISDGKLLDIQFTYNGGYSDLLFHTDTYGSFSSNYLSPSYVTYYFTDADVTNGAVQGYFDNTISGGDWNTATNWSSGKVSNAWANVTVASGTETTVDAAAAANDLTIVQGGELTLNNALTVGGNFLIESVSAGNGSFINNGTLTVTGNTTVQSFVSAGQWHGISAPVVGVTSNDLYLNDNPTVWLRSYNENDDTYTNITSLSESLGDMVGWMTWVGGSTDHTYSFTGALRNGTISKTLTKDGNGFNFVGNPYSSAIDWDASSGWGGTATLTGSIWVYDNGNWKVYNSLTHTGDQTRYIAMNQGFFVEASAAGTLTIDNSVCTHNNVPFRNTNTEQRTITLSLESNNLVDEAYIGYYEDATDGYDNFDAHKFFSFNENYPQLYSTANNFMAINSLPIESTDAVAMDVRGEDGSEMTISLSEVEGFDNVYLKDGFTGLTTDLKTASYTFNYNADITNRFNLFFSITGIDEATSDNIRIFAYDKNIHVVLDAQSNANIAVYNLIGQKITSRSTNSTVTVIPVVQSGYYVVKVSDGKYVSSQKVYIK